MHPYVHAQQKGDKAAVIMAATGETISYQQLDERSNQFAHYLRGKNIAIGDTVALCLENHERFFELVWGAQRAGLHYVAISCRLTADEISYILKDCNAKLLIGSDYLGTVLDDIITQCPDLPVVRLAEDGRDAFLSELQNLPITPIADERAGTDMLYSSGTTGRPKGVKLALPADPALNAANPLVGLAQAVFGIGEDSIYLSPAPLYHAAPLRWCMTVHKLGGTVIVMDKFDAEFALALIERYKVNASQWVPTHFVRMLKLPAITRQKYDVSSLTSAIHAAAPCPVAVKEKMIAWWCADGVLCRHRGQWLYLYQ